MIVQISVKTVRALGASYLRWLFRERAAAVGVPVSLHLDHCPDRAVTSEALAAGLDSLPLRRLRPLVRAGARAKPGRSWPRPRRYGAAVESEIEGITGVEDDVGSDEEGIRYPIEQLAGFIADTGVDLFAPAIGTAHGRYARAPQLSPERISELVAATGIPQVLHGGTGLTADGLPGPGRAGLRQGQRQSTAIKEAYLKEALRHLSGAATRRPVGPAAVLPAMPRPRWRPQPRSTSSHSESAGKAG